MCRGGAIGRYRTWLESREKAVSPCFGIESFLVLFFKKEQGFFLKKEAKTFFE
jgi:hypothetical protein